MPIGNNFNQIQTPNLQLMKHMDVATVKKGQDKPSYNSVLATAQQLIQGKDGIFRARNDEGSISGWKMLQTVGKMAAYIPLMLVSLLGEIGNGAFYFVTGKQAINNDKVISDASVKDMIDAARGYLDVKGRKNNTDDFKRANKALHAGIEELITSTVKGEGKLNAQLATLQSKVKSIVDSEYADEVLISDQDRRQLGSYIMQQAFAPVIESYVTANAENTTLNTKVIFRDADAIARAMSNDPETISTLRTRAGAEILAGLGHVIGDKSATDALFAKDADTNKNYLKGDLEKELEVATTDHDGQVTIVREKASELNTLRKDIEDKQSLINETKEKAARTEPGTKLNALMREIADQNDALDVLRETLNKSNEEMSFAYRDLLDAQEAVASAQSGLENLNQRAAEQEAETKALFGVARKWAKLNNSTERTAAFDRMTSKLGKDGVVISKPGKDDVVTGWNIVDVTPRSPSSNMSLVEKFLDSIIATKDNETLEFLFNTLVEQNDQVRELVDGKICDAMTELQPHHRVYADNGMQLAKEFFVNGDKNGMSSVYKEAIQNAMVSLRDDLKNGRYSGLTVEFEREMEAMLPAADEDMFADDASNISGYSDVSIRDNNGQSVRRETFNPTFGLGPVNAPVTTLSNRVRFTRTPKASPEVKRARTRAQQRVNKYRLGETARNERNAVLEAAADKRLVEQKENLDKLAFAIKRRAQTGHTQNHNDFASAAYQRTEVAKKV